MCFTGANISQPTLNRREIRRCLRRQNIGTLRVSVDRSKNEIVGILNKSSKHHSTVAAPVILHHIL